MTEPKLCKNCKHFTNFGGEFASASRCRRPISVDLSLVSGNVETKLNYESCEMERGTFRYKDSCGPEGKYFEQRDTFWRLIQELFTDIYSIFIPTKTNEKT